MSDHKTDNATSIKTLLKSSFWYTVSNFLTRAMVFLTTPIFTRLMTKQQYGDFSVFASWQSIFLIICGIEVYATLNRARFDYEAEGELNGYITSCLTLSTLITTVVFAGYLLFPSFFDQLFLLDRKYILIMFAYLYTQPAFLMFQAKQRIEYRYKLSAGLSFALISISTLAAVVLVCLIDEDRLMGRILGQYIPYIITGIILYTYFLQKSAAVKLRSWKYALMMGLPLVFSFLGSQILLASDKVVVQHLNFSEEVAWLVLATSCSHIMLIFVQSLNNGWSPWFFDKLRAERYLEIKNIFRLYMWFVVFCTFCVLMIGPEVVGVLGGKSYKESIYVLPANMLCGIFTVISTQFVNIETYHKKTHYAAVLTSIVAAINIAGDIVGVMLWGYQAACYVTVLCQLILIALHYFAIRKIGMEKIVAIKDLIYVLMISLLLIPISLVLYQAFVIRCSFIVVVFIAACIGIIFKRKVLLTFVKNIRNLKNYNK